QLAFACHLPRDVRDVARRDVVGRRVDEIARQPRALREDLAATNALRHLARLTSRAGDDAQRLDRLVALLPLVALEHVRSQDRAPDGGVRALARREPIAERIERDRARAKIARAAKTGRGRATHHLGPAVLAAAETRDDNSRGARSVRDVH